MASAPWSSALAADKKPKAVIGVSLLTMTNPFFRDLGEGMKAEAAKHGMDVVLTSGEFDAANQRNQVADFIVRRVDAIVLSPCDSKAVGTAVAEANKAGILDDPEIESVILRTKGFYEDLARLRKENGVTVDLPEGGRGEGDRGEAVATVTSSSRPRPFAAWLQHYGMAGVLLLLCVCSRGQPERNSSRAVPPRPAVWPRNFPATPRAARPWSSWRSRRRTTRRSSARSNRVWPVLASTSSRKFRATRATTGRRAISGLTVTAFRVPPFMATLAMMLVASGLAFKLARGQSIYEVPETFAWLGRGSALFSIPNAVVLMAVIFARTHLLMARTRFGRHVYAVGGNAEAARL